jgi:uncharacterized protein (DUF302 family)
MSEMGFEVSLGVGFDEAVELVQEELKKEGFGILTRIDVHDAFREKLDVDFRKYAILGACNPPLAHRALSDRPDVGLLLPCNVTVEEAADGSLVRIIDPEAMMEAGGMADDPTLAEVGAEAKLKLERVASALGAGVAVG